MQQSTETTGMNESGEISTAGTSTNVPSDEYLVAPARRLERDRVSKHRAGRTKALPKKQKARNKARAIRENRQAAMDAKALRKALGE